MCTLRKVPIVVGPMDWHSMREVAQIPVKLVSCYSSDKELAP